MYANNAWTAFANHKAIMNLEMCFASDGLIFLQGLSVPKALNTQEICDELQTESRE